jgi:hypothetical protein
MHGAVWATDPATGVLTPYAVADPDFDDRFRPVAVGRVA